MSFDSFALSLEAIFHHSHLSDFSKIQTLNSTISSPKILKAFLIAGIIETNCSPFLACVDSDCWLKSFNYCIVSFPTV